MNILDQVVPIVLAGGTLTRLQAKAVMDELSLGEFEEAQASRFLLALNAKTLGSEEIAGFVDSLRGHARVVSEVDPAPGLTGAVSGSGPRAVIDVCGTGGSSTSTFNVSTAVAFVVASEGVVVAKHGNRAVSSQCGSFDVLEELGIAFSTEPDCILRSIERFNLGFFYAPAFHPSLSKVRELRRKLGVKTVFNLLGPLLSPVRVKRQVIGVYDRGLLDKVGLALQDLGAEEAIVVYGEDGIDEFSISASSHVAHLRNGKILQYRVQPEDFGLRRGSLSEVAGGNRQKNAQMILDVLSGREGAARDLIVLNSAYAFLVAGRVDHPMDGVRLAQQALDSGKALKLLEQMRNMT